MRKMGMNCVDVQGDIRVVGMSRVTISLFYRRNLFKQKSMLLGFVVTF